MIEQARCLKECIHKEIMPSIAKLEAEPFLTKQQSTSHPLFFLFCFCFVFIDTEHENKGEKHERTFLYYKRSQITFNNNNIF